MNEADRRFSPIQELIERIESEKRPIDQYISRSLRELYLSGQYRMAIIKGGQNPSEKAVVEIIRIVGIRDGRLDSFILSTKAISEAEKRRRLDEIAEETGKLLPPPVKDETFGRLSNDAFSALTNMRLQTVAGMTISRSAATGNEIIQVLYPKAFRELLPLPISESSKNDLGYVVASYFLKTVPFRKR